MRNNVKFPQRKLCVLFGKEAPERHYLIFQSYIDKKLYLKLQDQHFASEQFLEVENIQQATPDEQFLDFVRLGKREQEAAELPLKQLLVQGENQAIDGAIFCKLLQFTLSNGQHLRLAFSADTYEAIDQFSQRYFAKSLFESQANMVIQQNQILALLLLNNKFIKVLIQKQKKVSDILILDIMNVAKRKSIGIFNAASFTQLVDNSCQRTIIKKVQKMHKKGAKQANYLQKQQQITLQQLKFDDNEEFEQFYGAIFTEDYIFQLGNGDNHVFCLQQQDVSKLQGFFDDDSERPSLIHEEAASLREDLRSALSPSRSAGSSDKRPGQYCYIAGSICSFFSVEHVGGRLVLQSCDLAERIALDNAVYAVAEVQYDAQSFGRQRLLHGMAGLEFDVQASVEAGGARYDCLFTRDAFALLRRHTVERSAVVAAAECTAAAVSARDAQLRSPLPPPPPPPPPLQVGLLCLNNAYLRVLYQRSGRLLQVKRFGEHNYQCFHIVSVLKQDYQSLRKAPFLDDFDRQSAYQDLDLRIFPQRFLVATREAVQLTLQTSTSLSTE